MENQPNLSRYPTHWGVRFLCDCKKINKAINIHKGIAHEICSNSVCILSEHHICQQKRIAMQLMIPSLVSDAPQKIVKIIGNSISTVLKDGKFLTEIKFLHFEEDGLNVLEKNLHQHFDSHLFAQNAHHA